MIFSVPSYVSPPPPPKDAEGVLCNVLQCTAAHSGESISQLALLVSSLLSQQQVVICQQIHSSTLTDHLLQRKGSGEQCMRQLFCNFCSNGFEF